MKKHRLPFSTYFPKGHPNFGVKTEFESFLINAAASLEKEDTHSKPEQRFLYEQSNGLKSIIKRTTIRTGVVKHAGDLVTAYVWEGKPYNSTQRVIFQDQPILWTKDIAFNIVADGTLAVFLDNVLVGIIKNHGEVEEYFPESSVVAKICYYDGISPFNLYHLIRPMIKRYDSYCTAQIICLFPCNYNLQDDFTKAKISLQSLI